MVECDCSCLRFNRYYNRTCLNAYINVTVVVGLREGKGTTKLQLLQRGIENPPRILDSLQVSWRILQDFENSSNILEGTQLYGVY